MPDNNGLTNQVGLLSPYISSYSQQLHPRPVRILLMHLRPRSSCLSLFLGNGLFTLLPSAFPGSLPPPGPSVPPATIPVCCSCKVFMFVSFLTFHFSTRLIPDNTRIPIRESVSRWWCARQSLATTGLLFGRARCRARPNPVRVCSRSIAAPAD